MAEWPVEVVDYRKVMEYGMVEPGGKVFASWANIQRKDGSVDPKAAVWIICPRCGTLGHCPRAGSRYDHGPSWEISEGSGLTMRPSILCNSNVRMDDDGARVELGRECGGHYWLTDGVLRDV